MKNIIITKIWAVLIGLSFILFMDSCLKETIPCDESVSLPSATDTGEGELGFLKNESVWVVSGSDVTGSLGATDQNEVNLGYFNGFIYLNGKMNRRCDENNPIDERFKLKLSNVFNTGTYTLDSLGDHFGSDNYCFLYQDIGVWKASNGAITVSKLDSIERIVSGIFEFELSWADDSTQTLSITEGRFDAKY